MIGSNLRSMVSNAGYSATAVPWRDLKEFKLFFDKKYSADKYEFYRTFTSRSGFMNPPAGVGWFLFQVQDAAMSIRNESTVWARKK